MRMSGFRGLALLGAALLIASGCVELTGQRVSWFYDAAKDELQILIHYDGIHESSPDSTEGAEQIPEFVEGGNVMFLDWPFHFQMAELRAKIQDENAGAWEREFARLVTSVKTEPVGYYREPDGHVGAAQRVTIPGAKDFIRRLNGLISMGILEQEISEHHEMARTLQQIRVAAQGDHQWITLDGHSLRGTLPVHPDEWARLKAKSLKELADDVAEALKKKQDDAEGMSVPDALRALTSVPVSYIDEGDRVVFVLGRATLPSTWRLDIRDEYRPSLEKVVVDAVKVDLDQALAEALLDTQAEPSPTVAAVLRWGPPEEPVRALVAAAERGDDAMKQAAVERLGSWADEWNRDHGVPKAPEQTDQVEGYLAAWKSWYAQMRQYPVFSD